jgi:ADP-ribose pyrophosphatase
MNENDCQIIEREVCYQGFYRLERLRLRHRLFAGGMSPAIVREVIEKGDVAAVLLYDPTRDEVVMIEQFRIGARDDPAVGGCWRSSPA